jgi:hypothetical protein
MERSTQSEKARIGAIGENNVVSKLMQHDWDAFNANCTIKNFKSIDIVCLNSGKCVESRPWMPSVALIQVKTSVQKNIPAGFTIGQCLDRQYLEQNVKGAYVFVAATKTNEHDYTFRYFIISRQDFIELIYQAHQFYVYGYTRVAGAKPLQDENRENGVDLKSPAGLFVRWLEGKSDEATDNHIAFKNPLNGVSCEDKWDNIWKD